MEIYVVQQGDSLSTIARKYGIRWEDILRINLLSSVSIVPGQALLIPVEAPEVERPTITVLGFIGIGDLYFDRTNIISYGPYNTFLALFGYMMDSNGNIIPPNDETDITATKETRAAATAVFSNLTYSGFNGGVLNRVLNDAGLRNAYINQLFEIVQQKGYQAVVIDFENLYPQDRETFITFLGDLSGRLRTAGIPLIVAVLPITGTEPSTATIPRAYDYASIGQNADYVMLMTYNWSYATTSPGPIAPYPQVRQTVRYAINHIPSEKILLGFSRYGFDWIIPFHPTQPGATLGVQDAVVIAMREQVPIQFDSVSLTPWFSYRNQYRDQHIVWFEDVRSIQVKFELIKRYRLGGIGTWQYGQRFPQFIPFLLDNFTIRYI